MTGTNARRRVVITGVGVVCPLGNNVDEMWERALAGQSGIGPLTAVDPEQYPCQVAGQVQGFDPTEYMGRKDARRMARFSQFGVAAAQQAVVRHRHVVGLHQRRNRRLVPLHPLAQAGEPLRLAGASRCALGAAF